jgi:hypothetical protein
MSGCEKLLKKATLRHNNAGALIVEAIYMGEKGHHLIAADAGLNKRRRAEGEAPLDLTRTIPESALPTSIPKTVRAKLCKQRIPDDFVYNYNRYRSTRRMEYTVVEIKYCRDTKHEEQEARAVEQHKSLVDALNKYAAAAEVKYCVLLLGVGGVIYLDFSRMLSEDLGVITFMKGNSLDALLRKLHFKSIEAVGEMWKHRRAVLHNKLGAKKKRIMGMKRARPNQPPPHRPTKKRKK